MLLTDLRMTTLAGSPIINTENWAIEMPSSPRHQISRKLDEFVRLALDEHLNLYRMALQNRCRVRRTFAQSVAILDSLQAMAEQFDADMINIARMSASSRHPLHLDENGFYPLSSWLYYHKLNVMGIVVAMGFELDIYTPDELATSYALLSYFASSQVDNIRTILTVLDTRFMQARASRNPDDTTPAQTEIVAAIQSLEIRLSESVVKVALASALADLYSMIILLGLIPVPAHTASSADLRHELRLKPFVPIGTPSLPGADELDPTLRSDSESVGSVMRGLEDKLKLAKMELAALKKCGPEQAQVVGVEEGWQRENKALLFVAVSVGVAAAGIKDAVVAAGLWDVQWAEFGRRISADEARRGGIEVQRMKDDARQGLVLDIPSSGKRQHDWWVVPKVTSRKK